MSSFGGGTGAPASSSGFALPPRQHAPPPPGLGGPQQHTHAPPPGGSFAGQSSGHRGGGGPQDMRGGRNFGPSSGARGGQQQRERPQNPQNDYPRLGGGGNALGRSRSEEIRRAPPTRFDKDFVRPTSPLGQLSAATGFSSCVRVNSRHWEIWTVREAGLQPPVRAEGWGAAGLPANRPRASALKHSGSSPRPTSRCRSLSRLTTRTLSRRDRTMVDRPPAGVARVLRLRPAVWAGGLPIGRRLLGMHRNPAMVTTQRARRRTLRRS